MTNFIWPSDLDRAENDELARVCDHLEHVLDERDALAAQVERLHRALDNVLHEVGTHSHDDLSDDEKAALEALAETPATSLTKRDLLQRAEALEDAYKHTDDAAAQDYLHDEANSLRRQAEELT